LELTNEEKQIIIDVLNQISCPINQAKKVLTIIEKLEQQLTS